MGHGCHQWTPGALASLLVVAVFGTAVGMDASGCGGFVKSAVPIDFSQLEVVLSTASGHVKYRTECAPNNGYYFLPFYEKGDFVLSVVRWYSRARRWWELGQRRCSLVSCRRDPTFCTVDLIVVVLMRRSDLADGPLSLPKSPSFSMEKPTFAAPAPTSTSTFAVSPCPAKSSLSAARMDRAVLP